jgi:hypothetical protein
VNALLAWAGPAAYWGAVAWGGWGILRGLGLIRCRAGDWGTAFLVGFAVSMSLVYFAALAGAPIAAPLLIGAAAVTLGSGLLLARRRPLSRPAAPPWTMAERVLLVGFAVYCIAVIQSALYFPTTAMDAHSYDGRAQFMLRDHRLDLGLYHWPGGPVTAQTNISYPPLMSLAFAGVYALGGWQPGLVIAGFALAWPLTIYGALRQRIPRFAALAWTLFLALTPEIFSHAANALLNLPAMALVAAEAISLARFLGSGERRWLLLAGILAAGASGVRPDALPVHAALWAVALAFSLSDATRRAALARWLPAFLAAGAAPAVTWGSWALYLRYVIGLSSMVPVGGGESIGVGAVLEAAGRSLFRWDLFGATFFAWVITLPFLVLRPRAGREARFFHAAAFAVLGALVIAFSLINPRYGGGTQDVLSMSFKRALFYLVPLVGLASALSPPWRQLARHGFRWVHAERVPKSSENA